MLQPDKLKKLNENALKMAEAGKSKEEILAMKDAFIEQFGSKESVKKKVDTTSITPSQNLVSGQKTGSSATPKSVDDLFALKPKSQTDKSLEKQNIKAQKNIPSIVPKEINRKDIAIPAKRETVINKQAEDFEREQKMIEAEKFKSTISKYENDRQLSEEEKAQKIKEAEDEINGTGFVNKISDYGKKAWNVVAPVLGLALNQPVLSRAGVETDVLAEDKEAFIQNKKKEGVKTSTLTPDEINNGAKELFLKKKIDKAQEDKETLLIENLDDDTKKKLEINIDQKYGGLKDRDKLYYVRTENAKNRINELNNGITTLLEKNKRNEPLTEEEIDFARNYETNAKELQKQYSENYDRYNSNNKELGSVEQEHDMLNRSYHDGINFASNIALNSGRIALGFAQAENKLSELALGENEESKKYSQDLAQWQNDIDNISQTEFAKQTEGFKGVDDTIKYVGNVVSSQLPNMVLMSASGGLSTALPAIGGYSFGNKMNEMVQSNKDGTTNYTPAQMYASATISGGAEMFETATFGNLLKLKRFVGAVGKEPMTRELLKKSIKDNVKTFTKGIASEEAEELMTYAIQDFSDTQILGQKKTYSERKDAIKRIIADTGTMSLLLQGAPHATNILLKPFATKTYVSELDKNSKDILRLTKELQNTNLTEGERNILQTSLDKVTKQSSDMVNAFVKNTANLSEEDKDKLIELEDSTSKARAKAEEIKASKSITLETKQKELNDLKTEYLKSEDLRTKIIEGKTTILDVVSDDKKEEMKSNALKSLVKETEGSNEAQFTNDVIEQKAIELYNNQIKSKDAKTEIPTTKTESKTEVQESTKIIEPKEVNPIKDNETITFYTGRDKKISDFTTTRGEHIFFSKNKDISNWYGGDESNVTEANIDTSNFIDLTSQEKKTKFVEENFTDKDIEELYIDEIKNEENRDRFGKKSRQELIEKYRKRAEENRFSGDGKEQNFLLKKIKEKGFSGVALKDSFFGKEDISYVVNDKSVIKTKNETQAQGDFNVNGDVRVTDNTNLPNKRRKEDVSELQPTSYVGESKPNVKRVKSLKDAEYDVSFDETGNVSKINSVKDGREIPKFIERVNPKTGKTILVKNANYARIEADSLGEQLESRIKSDDKKSFDNAVLNFEPNTEYDVALNALANGAKVSMESLQKELGNTDQKWATVQSKTNLPSIETLSEQIWEESGKQLDQTEIRNQLIDIIQTNPDLETIKSKLVDSYNETQIKKQEQELEAYFNTLSEKDRTLLEGQLAEDEYLNELTNEEKLEYYEKQYGQEESKTELEQLQEPDRKPKTSTPSVQERTGEKEEQKQEVKPKKEYDKDSFEVSASVVPNGEVGEYLSGKTIEKYTGEKAQNDQEILKVKLEEALTHGVSTINKAKEQFGNDFVTEVLKYLDKAPISPEAKALTYISLENELVKNKKDGFPYDLTIQKQLDLVREKRQAFARSNSLALNMNRLQKFGEIGFNIESLTDKFFSEKTKEAKKSIEETIQVKSEDVNNQDDAEQSGEVSDEIKALIQEGIDKEIDKIYKKLPTNRRAKAEKAINALEKIQKNLRANAYDATIGVPIAIIDGGISVIKNAIKAGANIADAIELGINHIKDKYGKDWDNEDRFRKDMSDGFKSENVDLKEKTKADDSIKGIVKQALIGAGYSREVTQNGEKVKRLDWVKLAGEEGSVENIQKKVEEVLLKEGGYSKKQIEEMQNSLQEEYNRLSAEIVEKGLNELEKRNLIKPSPNRKSESKRLAELYNMGLLDKNENEYDNLLNKVLGLSEFEQNVFNKIKAKTKALADIYNAEANGKKITEHSLQTVANDLNHEIKELLNAVSYKEGDFKYKLITSLTDYAGLSQKALLGGLPNLIENVFSGRFAGIEQKIFTDKVLTPELRKQIKKDKKIIYDDITRNAGLYYGDTNTSLVSSSRFEDWINGKTDNRMAHAVLSAITLRSWLDGADSRAKVGLSSKLFIKNAVEILTSKSNPNGAMKREDAIKFVSESLTGDSFDKALETAKSIIDDVNSKQETKQLKDTPEAIHRFAMNLVKENLMQDNRMTMEQIDTAFKSGYKSAGRDIGHEANNTISRGVNLLNASLNTELEKAVSEKRFPEATLLASKMLIMRTVVNPFVGGGTNWIILGLEKSGSPLGYISTLFNATKKQELDLGTVSGIKNMSEALYRKNNYQSSLTRNIIGTSIALAMIASLNIDVDDEEDVKDKLNKWLEENKWAKRYFEKLAPESVVFMLSLENKELGKHLAKVLGMNGDTFNNASKLLKSLDKEDTSTYGKAGQLTGQALNSPLAWKTVKDVQNVVRGLKGLEEIKTDYKATGFWNGYFQGGLIEYLGMRPNKENTDEKTKSKQSGKYSKF